MYLINRLFGIVFIVFIYNSNIYASDYMSVELQKAISIECEKKLDNNEYDTVEECTNYLIEALNAIGIVSVSRTNDLEIQKEIEIVGEIQKSLLSQNKKDSFPIAGINIPAKVVSGDFYNFSDLGDGKYGFGVADVSGKGIKSSLLMSKASSLYRCLSKTMFSASELLTLLNNEICETISRGMFVTMLIGIYDSNKKELLLSSASRNTGIEVAE